MGNACPVRTVCAHSLWRAGAHTHAQRRESDDDCVGAADCYADIAAVISHIPSTDAASANPTRSNAVSAIVSIITTDAANTQLQHPGDRYAANDRRPLL